MGIPFGKYALLRKLAEGGMAEVFLARQTGMEGFEKLVVVKRILPSLSKETDFIKMFLNEARVAARLNHPNVVQIWDLGRIDALYFIAMEYVHGEDLREIIKTAAEHKLRPAAGLVCRILADTLAGLHYAHIRTGAEGKPLGLVHRDVSPQNVLVTYEGGIKLVDFGIAKATRATSEQTQAGLFKGKFAYMSPEQSRGQPIDARSDVFSVGILMWELLTWRRLFKRPSEMATLIAVGEDEIPPVRSIDPSVPPELERIVMRALERPLAKRYGSALEMRADLEALIRAERWEADAMALGHYLHQLFAEKIEAQASDMRAAGVGSIDDFLLSVDESTQISWMEPPGAHKSSSLELPAADEPPLAFAETSGRGAPEGPRPSPPSPAAPAAKDRSSPMIKLPASLPTAPMAVAVAPADELPSQATMIVPPSPPPTLSPPDSRINDTVRHPAFDNDTAPRTAIDLRSGLSQRLRRILVIGSAATVVAAIGLTVAFWPTAPVPTVPSVPLADSQLPSAAPKPATLLITTDAPAVIAVDGTAAPLGRSSTVQVKAGVEHVVTVRRPGHSLHTVHVPILGPGEQLPLQVQVR